MPLEIVWRNPVKSSINEPKTQPIKSDQFSIVRKACPNHRGKVIRMKTLNSVLDM